MADQIYPRWFLCRMLVLYGKSHRFHSPGACVVIIEMVNR
jgi:hypothetical protein